MAMPCFYLTTTPSVTACRHVPHPFTFLPSDMLARLQPIRTATTAGSAAAAGARNGRARRPAH
ncbi:hypothetical protein N9Q18_01785 [bacterium]|nr:hypothetical protein [bacterium]